MKKSFMRRLLSTFLALTMVATHNFNFSYANVAFVETRQIDSDSYFSDKLIEWGRKNLKYKPGSDSNLTNYFLFANKTKTEDRKKIFYGPQNLKKEAIVKKNEEERKNKVSFLFVVLFLMAMASP